MAASGRRKRFGYRVNAVGGNGEYFVNNSDLTRKMISVAADARPFDHTVVEGFYSHYNLEQRGFPGWFTYGRAERAQPVRLRSGRGAGSGRSKATASRTPAST